jgi:arsenate reductase-like glutaredoxin family protein
VNAKKETLGRDEALALVRSASQLYVAKGKKVIHIDLKKERPSEDELAKLLLGPTGNLRAPTLRKGRTIVVGFDEETYEKLLT